MNHGLGFCDVVRQANARASLLVRVHEVEMVVANAQVDGKVSNGRKMVLHVEAGLPALAPTLERGENLWATTAVEEKAFPFAQPDEVDPCLEKMAAPGVREIALDAKRKRRARRRRKWRDQVARRQNLIGTRAFVNGSVQQRLRRKRVEPSEDRRELAKMPLCIAADCLVIGNIGLLKIGAGAHQQELDRVVVSGTPVIAWWRESLCRNHRAPS